MILMARMTLVLASRSTSFFWCSSYKGFDGKDGIGFFSCFFFLGNGAFESAVLLPWFPFLKRLFAISMETPTYSSPYALILRFFSSLVVILCFEFPILLHFLVCDQGGLPISVLLQIVKKKKVSPPRPVRYSDINAANLAKFRIW
jgi:hypothetical protein